MFKLYVENSFRYIFRTRLFIFSRYKSLFIKDTCQLMVTPFQLPITTYNSVFELALVCKFRGLKFTFPIDLQINKSSCQNSTLSVDHVPLNELVVDKVAIKYCAICMILYSITFSYLWTCLNNLTFISRNFCRVYSLILLSTKIVRNVSTCCVMLIVWGLDCCVFRVAWVGGRRRIWNYWQRALN